MAQHEADKSLYHNVSTWPLITFGWLNTLLRVGYVRPLEARHLPVLPPIDRADSNTTRFEAQWRAEQEAARANARPPRLWRALVRTFGWEFLVGGVGKLAQDSLLFVGPLVLHALIAFMKDPAAPTSRGVGLALAMFVGSVAQSLALHHYFFRMYRVGLRVRSAMIQVIYKKAFVLSNKARQTSTVGEIVNHQSADAKRLNDLTPYLHLLWSAPYQIGMSLYFLSGVLGWATVGGLAVMVVLIPVNLKIAKVSGKLQKKVMECKDRVSVSLILYSCSFDFDFFWLLLLLLFF